MYVFKNTLLAHALVYDLDSICEECDDLGREQDCKVTGEISYEHPGLYPHIYCRNCQSESQSGDSNFFDFYSIYHNPGYDLVYKDGVFSKTESRGEYYQIFELR